MKQKNKLAAATMPVWVVTRDLSYVLTQRFAVAATDIDSAKDKLYTYVDATDWSLADQRKHGVVQISDTMDQVECSQEIYAAEVSDDDDAKPASPDELALELSLFNLLLENRIHNMLALLRKLAGAPNMHIAGIADLGAEVLTFVESVDAEVRDLGVLLSELPNHFEPTQA